MSQLLQPVLWQCVIVMQIINIVPTAVFYLTGFAEPEAVAVIQKWMNQLMKVIPTMSTCERNREMEIWNGYRAGLEGAIELFEADEVFCNCAIRCRNHRQNCQ